MLQVAQTHQLLKASQSDQQLLYHVQHNVLTQCQFTKFARLVDISYDATNVRFNNCDFNTAYYGALIGAEMDGSTNGLTMDQEIYSSQVQAGAQ